MIVVYDKVLRDIEDFDPMDILNSDDITVDDFGDPKGHFEVKVTFVEDTDSD
jgi:hypothetical protein